MADDKKERIERAAVAAMQGMLTSEDAKSEDSGAVRMVAAAAVRYASALIAAIDGTGSVESHDPFAAARAALIPIIATEDDPMCRRVRIELTPENATMLIVNWPESMHSADVREAVTAAVHEALPAYLKHLRVTVT